MRNSWSSSVLSRAQQLGFVGFVLFHWLHCITLLALQTKLATSGSAKPETPMAATDVPVAPPFLAHTLRLRGRAFAANVVVFLAAVYFYLSHTASCTQFYYSFFEMCEWSLVLIVIGFHCIAAIDWPDFDWKFTPVSLPASPVSVSSSSKVEPVLNAPAVDDRNEMALEIEPLVQR